MRSDISRPTPRRSRRSARAPATPPCPAGRGFRSSFRRCIRATRRSRASACSPSSCRACSSSRAWRKDHDLQFTIDAEEADRLELSLDIFGRGAARSVARRLGRFRPRRAGLSEARARRDRLGRGRGHAHRPPFHGAAGQGRLLGHRDQARAGARARRLSGVHAQGHDRPLLHGLREKTARGAAASSFRNSPPTTRSPSRASSRTPGGVEGFEFQRLHGMGEALYEALLAELPGRRLPHLRAGRRPPRPARLSGAPAAGKRRQLVLRVGRRRSKRAGRARSCAGRRTGIAGARGGAQRKIPLPRDLYRPERRNSAGVEFGERGKPRRAARRGPRRRGAAARGRAAGRRRRAAAATSAKCSRRSTASPIGSVHEADAATSTAAMAAAAAGFPAWAATPVDERAPIARARRRAARSEARRASSRCLQTEGGKTLDDALAEVREAVDYCRYYAAQARAHARRRSRCPDRPARATCCAIAAAASSSASARGIFRSRSSSAR